MALQLGALREALLEAGASAEKAGSASEEVAAYDNRLERVESGLRLVQAMLGVNLLLTAGVLWRVIGGH